MAALIILPPAAKFLKKLKDKPLKRLYDIYHNRINYELAYTVEERFSEDSGEKETVVVIMAGTRENFYDELKRYWL